MTNQTARVLRLLRWFNDNQTVCIDGLQNNTMWEGKSVKTVRRDLDVIKLIFPESFELIRGEKGCYKAITKKAFNNFMNERTISLMVQTFNMAQRNNLFDSLDINKSDQSIIKNKLHELGNVYEFKNKPFESKKGDYEIFKKLESSIRFHKIIILNYQDRDRVIQITGVKPYKIVFMNENFYLACEVDSEEFEFTPFRISKIVDVIDSSDTFYHNPDIQDFISDMQTPFSKYRRQYRKYLIDVKLEVDSSKAFYFKSKKYLKSQKILETKENGNLIISYRVTQERELDDLIKRWLPNIKVLEPLSLKEKIRKDLEQYLENY